MSNTLVRRHGFDPYPWKRWMDGRWHTAIPGKHFQCKPLSFRRLIDFRAKDAKRDAQIEFDLDRETGEVKSVRFRFSEPPVTK